MSKHLLFPFLEVIYADNLDLDHICTPIDVKAFEELLNRSNYDQEKTRYICEGFRHGFSIHYTGPTDRQTQAENLKLVVGDHLELWNKVMTEVQLGRFGGPFTEIPERYLSSHVQSPLGLVPKPGFTDEGKPKTRLIFHLNHSRKLKNSINHNTDENFKHVKYKDLDYAVMLCQEQGKNCFMSKTGKFSITVI